MSVTRTVKLFRNGASQAVRLPADFRFEGSEIYATRDEETGDVLLSTQPGRRVWKQFFEQARAVDECSGFMSERPMNAPPQERDLFGVDT